MPIPRILVSAGSDSGGGAGIQADIKTITMLGGHAMTAVTAITAQNTTGVQAVHQIPTAMVLAQIDSVVSDIGVDAVKIGMIGSAETANAVADRLEAIDVPIVFDPVMISTSGHTLADQPTIAAFERLMRLASVVTPNMPELEALGGKEAILAHGCHLLAKGGHAEGYWMSFCHRAVRSRIGRPSA
jgi:hydroxymethylpyrimidine/phosphomethylpyrimidine kinase